jgi:hypothetical protein
MRAVLRISSGVRRRDLRVEDLRGEARDAYRIWHDFVGLSEASALDLVRADGLVEESGVDGSGVHGSGVDGLAGPLGNIFGLSEAAARVASRGRGSVSETAGRSSAAPQPGDALRLVGKVEELAASLCRRGVSEEKALREAAFALFEAAPDSSRIGLLRLRTAGGHDCGVVRVRPLAARATLLARWAGRPTASGNRGVKVPDLGKNRRSSVGIRGY